jgi:transcription elongation GreA/GreB family factor
MSKAFTKESDDDGASEAPERIISDYPNLVTPQGLAAIDGEIERLSAARAATPADDRETQARLMRDLRYWTARRNSALLAPAPPDEETVAFGSTVTIARADGREQTWRIVGEDEADPAAGTLSHAAPLARALIGKSVGDDVQAGASEAEITAISV